MGGCRCTFRNCKSATKTNSDLHFFHYPVKHKDRCQEWVRNARRPEFFILPDDQLRNKVVCDLHFEACCFTNVLRKRLVHNAVPTLAAGCEDEILNEGSGEFPSMDILPANEDGTIFTLDTDSIQQKTEDPISTYSLKNGNLVPVYEEMDDADGHQVVYTIDQDDFKVVPSFQENGEAGSFVYVNSNESKEPDTAENYEIVFNGETQQPTVEKKQSQQAAGAAAPAELSCKSEPKKSKPTSSMHPVEVVYVSESTLVKVKDIDRKGNPLVDIKTEADSKAEVDTKPAREKMADPPVGKRKRPDFSVGRKVFKKINNHSREIASLKKALFSNVLHKSTRTNLNAFNGKVHPTLLGALTISLYKKESNFTKSETDFLITLYKSSPECYNLLKDKLHWNLPPSNVVKDLIA